jgi:riboflavin synthase
VFTGIVEALGTVVAREGGRLRIACPYSAELARGESVAVHGVCLTVEAADGETFGVTAVPATLERTTLGRLGPGARVNLERALRADGRWGGHIVQGHVDGVGTVLERRPDPPGWRLCLAAPEEVLRFLVPRGAVAVDGVSLTVAGCDRRAFEVALIPHTAAVTTLGRLQAGDAVNLEADILAKYVAALCAGVPAGTAERGAGHDGTGGGGGGA